MRVLVLGAGGMLGRDLTASAPAGVELFPFTHAELDITDAAALERRVCEAAPDVVINAAAYTAVDRAESEREIAFRTNGEAVSTLGKLAARAGALVVHYSTDYVFDGSARRPYREDDRVNPVNVYGASKLAGEQALTESGAQYLLVRTSWLFGVHGRSFPRTMWERASAGLATRVVRDQFGRPTFAADLAQGTWELLDRRVRGVFHVANTGTATWYDIAERVFDEVARCQLLTPCATAEYPTPARRPAYSVLDTTRVEPLLGSPLPSWRSALDRFLRALRAAKLGGLHVLKPC